MKPKVFNEPELPLRKKRQNAACVFEDYPDSFSSEEDAFQFLKHIFVSASNRWAYSGNGKSGTSSTKRFIFELEFGSKLTVALDNPKDINPDSNAHGLTKAGVFRSLVSIAGGIDLLDGVLRITTVRHPLSRVLSAFNYLCIINDRAHVWMVEERLRMNAMVGFDWEKEPRTSRGLAKFLNYIELCTQANAERIVNPHWRIQVDNIHPDVFKPHIIGRTEDLGTFYREIAERLDQPLPENWILPEANKSQYATDPATLITPEIERQIENIYRRDFEEFGYQPDEWRL